MSHSDSQGRQLKWQRIGYIVEIMSNSFGTSEHHITLCMRDEGDNLVTQANLASKVESQEVLK